MKISILSVICFLLIGNIACAEESATPEEIISKVRAAAEFLSKAGEAGLAQFNEPKGQWVWKDTYVFVYNCGKEEIAAHVNNKLIKYRLSELIDKNGRYLGFDLCAESLKPKGGWTEYWWPKAGSTSPERKISYILKVPGQPYQAGAGIYNPGMTLEKLNGLIK